MYMLHINVFYICACKFSLQSEFFDQSIRYSLYMHRWKNFHRGVVVNLHESQSTNKVINLRTIYTQFVCTQLCLVESVYTVQSWEDDQRDGAGTLYFQVLGGIQGDPDFLDKTMSAYCTDKKRKRINIGLFFIKNEKVLR